MSVNILNKKCIGCGEKFYKKAKFSIEQFEQTKYCTIQCCWSNRIVWNKDKKVGSKTRSTTSFKKGKASWNKGLKGLPSGKKGKSYPNVQGKNHWNWQGGRTPKLLALRQTVEYKNWRVAVFGRDNYTCVQCGQKQRLEADHIKQFAYYPELRFDINNGQTLCRDCHYKKPVFSYQGNRIFVRTR